MTNSSILLLAIRYFSFCTVHSTTNGDAFIDQISILYSKQTNIRLKNIKKNAPAKYIELPNLTVFLDD